MDGDLGRSAQLRGCNRTCAAKRHCAELRSYCVPRHDMPLIVVARGCRRRQGVAAVVALETPFAELHCPALTFKSINLPAWRAHFLAMISGLPG
jgi:hypothetical protein